MKGVPEEPRCGFSNAVVQILRMHGVTYDAHDVLKDEELRKGVTCTMLILNNVIFIMLEVVCDTLIRFCYSSLSIPSRPLPASCTLILATPVLIFGCT